MAESPPTEAAELSSGSGQAEAGREVRAALEVGHKLTVDAAFVRCNRNSTRNSFNANAGRVPREVRSRGSEFVAVYLRERASVLDPAVLEVMMLHTSLRAAEAQLGTNGIRGIDLARRDAGESVLR
jgi:hypothetical protein